MRAIILAAGIGSRLGEKGKSIPKCLIKVFGESLLERQIRILKSCGIDSVRVVIGTSGECWTKENTEAIIKIHDDVVFNDKNIELKRPYTLLCGLKGIKNEDLLIIDGDLFFEERVIKRFLENHSPNAILGYYIESRNIEGKGTKVVLDSNNNIVNFGYGFESNIIFGGIFKISKGALPLLDQALLNPESWKKDLSEVLEKVAGKINLQCFPINSPLSALSAKNSAPSESWEPVINRVERRGNIMRKSTVVGKKKLMHEFNFLKDLPEGLKNHFPRVFESGIQGESTYYDMEYCEYPSFEKLVIEKKISTMESTEIIKVILDFVFKELYTKNIKKTPQGFIRDSYFSKIKQRIAAVKGKSNTFDQLVSCKQIVINGKNMKNFPDIVYELESNPKLLASLEPPRVSMYHGDFRPANMLVNPATKDFILIDPRGKTAAGECESYFIEDIARFLKSTHSYYPIFHDHNFKISIDVGKIASVNYDIIDKESKNILDEFTKNFMKLLPEYELIKKQPNWERNLLFLESMLLLANAPFHLTSKEEEDFSIALLVRGIELLNEFIEKEPAYKEEKLAMINVNLPEDIALLESGRVI